MNIRNYLRRTQFDIASAHLCRCVAVAEEDVAEREAELAAVRAVPRPLVDVVLGQRHAAQVRHPLRGRPPREGVEQQVALAGLSGDRHPVRPGLVGRVEVLDVEASLPRPLRRHVRREGAQKLPRPEVPLAVAVQLARARGRVLPQRAADIPSVRLHRVRRRLRRRPRDPIIMDLICIFATHASA